MLQNVIKKAFKLKDTFTILVNKVKKKLKKLRLKIKRLSKEGDNSK